MAWLLSLFLLLAIMMILMLASVRVIVGTRVVSEEKFARAAYGRAGAILGIWAAYGGCSRPVTFHKKIFFLQMIFLRSSRQVGISILSILIPRPSSY